MLMVPGLLFTAVQKAEYSILYVWDMFSSDTNRVALSLAPLPIPAHDVPMPCPARTCCLASCFLDRGTASTVH